jgi:hypothetical protein
MRYVTTLPKNLFNVNKIVFMRVIKNYLIVFLLGCFAFITNNTYSQTGTISGLIKDSVSAEDLAGAVVFIDGTSVGASTDAFGAFEIKNVKPGTYTLKVQYVGYRTKTIPGVEVKANESTKVNAQVTEDSYQLNAIEITAQRRTNTVNSVIEEEKNSDQVVDGISGDQARTSQDRDAGQVIQRIPGVTIINNRFALIRGLSERYNTVMINDAISPSTEADRRSFSFDLIPTNLLDRMLIYKSGSAEIPGDFAGGVIKIYTRSVPDSNSFNIGISTGYRAGTTFNPYLHTNTSPTDFLGFDNGSRRLPNDFPKTLNKLSSAELAEKSKLLSNNFKVEEGMAIPDIRVSADVSRKFTVKNKEAGVVAAINYSNTYQYFQSKRSRYLEFDADSSKSPKQTDFVDDQYSNSIRLGILNNWFFKFNNNHKIEFRNMFNQLGENETIIRNGVSLYQRSGDSLRNYSFKYSSRSLYSGQLNGTHEFNNDKTTYHWFAGLSYINRELPDLRRARTYTQIGSNDPYKVIIPPTATTFDASRFYSNLNEYTAMNSGDFEHKFFDPANDTSGFVIKAGYYVEQKSRTFRARWTSYKSRNNQAADSLSALPLDEIFDAANMDAKNGFFLTEGTNPSDKYDAQNFLSAGYTSLLIPYKKFKFISGVRAEYNILSLQSATQTAPVEVSNPVLSILPFANISYNITPKMLLRTAYSKTVNRPEFREIAPFLFYDFDFNFDVVGNPNLKVATIHNADLRWELYPGAGESFSLGAFYKKFIDPIESYIRQGADNPIYTYNNAVSAENYGLEMDLRKSLYELSSVKFIKNLSIVFNGALIKSKVDLGTNVTSQDTVRALQGQSPYIVNGGIYYTNEDNGLSFNIVYNVFGKRIFIVGDRVNPTVYEMPRHSLDLTINKRITKKLEARFGVQDILNYQTRLLQDSNLDSKVTSVDEPILTFKRGTYFTAGLNFSF